MLRRRELAPVLPGVYVDHTGEPTWKQRAWAAVLYSWPATLSHDSALRAADGPGRRGRDVDLERDLDAAVEGGQTLRIGYGQVFDRACRTAERIGAVLQQRGWGGEPGRCPDCPPGHSATGRS